jgi:hypothetical protein
VHSLTEIYLFYSLGTRVSFSDAELNQKNCAQNTTY